jgi:H+/Cl- antiporter ClcA
MRNHKYLSNQLVAIKEVFRWTALLIPVAVTVGLLVALFLWLLEIVTELRFQNPWLLFLLPLAGLFIFFLYKSVGKNSEAGNNLIIDEIHSPGGGVPARMAPLILISTVITHLFGGSAGREGTAVQMGGSISAVFAGWFNLPQERRRILLMCGISAGFGAVFGTPVAAAIFALEVLEIGRLKYDALIPCLIAAVIAHITCISTGIQHTAYHIPNYEQNTQLMPYISFDILLLLKAIIAGACFGLASLVFVKASHFIKNQSLKLVSKQWLIPIIGGIAIIGLTYLTGTRDYLGLGVTNPGDGVSIVSAFDEGGSEYFSWLWKLIFTSITLGTGFKGGEVTPLFFIGATLGNTLALISNSPVALFAALGFIGVFAGATNTPLACTIMGVELFGGNYIVYFAVACFTAYYFSGHSGIYKSQKLAVSKFRF